LNVACRGSVYKTSCTWIWPSTLCSEVFWWQQCIQYSVVWHWCKIWDKVIFYVECFDFVTTWCWCYLFACLFVICMFVYFLYYTNGLCCNIYAFWL